MMTAIARALAALGIILLVHGVGNAQPALPYWTCTGWSQVEPTMLNPFGQACTQWTVKRHADLNQIPPPPIGSPAQPAGSEVQTSTPKADKATVRPKEKNGHAR